MIGMMLSVCQQKLQRGEEKQGRLDVVRKTRG